MKKSAIIGIIIGLILVLCLVGSASATTNIFTNPSFSSGTSTGWSQDVSGGDTPNFGFITYEVGDARFDVMSNSVFNSQYADLYQSVNLTGVDEVTFDISVSYANNISASDVFGYVQIGNSIKQYTVGSGTTSYSYFTLNNLQGGSTSSSYVTVHVDTSSYSGNYDFHVYFYSSALSPTSSKVIYVIANVTDFEGYATAPTVTTPTISKTAGGLKTTVTVTTTISGGYESINWQYWDGTGTWKNISGATTNPYIDTINDSDSTNHYYRPAVTWSGGVVYSPSYVVYTSYPAPSLTISADSSAGKKTQTVSLTSSSASYVSAYQWQQKTGSGSWSNISGATSSTYSASISDSSPTTHYYRVYLTGYGSQTGYSNTVSYTSYNAPTANTPSISATQGGTSKTITLTANTSGTVTSYQWQKSSDGSTWSDMSGKTTAEITDVISDSVSTVHYYRVVVTGYGGSDTSSSVSYTSYVEPVISNPTATPSTGGMTDTFSLSATVTGDATSYQWQEYLNSSWSNISTATSRVSSITLTDTAPTTHTYRLSVTWVDGTVNSTSTTYTSISYPVIDSVTSDISQGGLEATVNLTAVVHYATSYQWQESTDSGTTWSNISGANNVTYAMPIADQTPTTHIFRMYATGLSGSTASTQTATYTSYAKPVVESIGANPSYGEKIKSVIVSATVSGATSYQWQKSSDGSTWTDVSGETGLSFTDSINDQTPTTHYYHILATGVGGTTTSNYATYNSYNPPTVSNTQATPSVGGFNQSVGLSAEIEGNVSTYQWQESTDNGSTWTDISGATMLSYTYSISDQSATTHKFRLQVTGYGGTGVSSTYGTYTSYAEPTVTITASPEQGGLTQSVVLTATATNTTSYQWQESTDGTTFTNISGAINATYTKSVDDQTPTTHYFRVIATGNGGSTTSLAKTYVSYAKPTITGIDADPDEGGLSQTVSLSVTATGTGTLTYQWQHSTNGSTYTDISGAVQSTYSYPVTDQSATTHYFKAVVTGTGGSVTSSPVTYVSYAVPTVATPTISVTQGALENDNIVLQSSVSGTYTSMIWQHSTNGSDYSNITGAVSTTYTASVDDNVATTHYYRLSATGYGGTGYSTTKTYTSYLKPEILGISATPSSGDLTKTVILGVTVNSQTSVTGYQWQKYENSTWSDMSGETSASATVNIADTTPTSHAYRVIVTGIGGSTTSSEVTYVSYSRPYIYPISVTPSQGGLTQSVTLTASVTGATSLQWQKSSDGTTWSNISGAIAATYTDPITDTTPTTHYYRIIATNNAGDTTSDVKTYTSYLLPTITNPKANPTSGGTTASIVLSATVTGASSLQWQKQNGSNWVDINGATTNPYTFSGELLAGTHTFRLQATNSSGTTNSDTCTYVAYNVPVISSITANPTSGSLSSTVSLSADVSGESSVQWQQLVNGVWQDIDGKIYENVTVSVTDQTSTLHSYRLVATGTGGSVNSSVVTYQTYDLPTAGTSTVSPTQGLTTQLITLTGNSTGTGTLTYQWQQSTNGVQWTNISGADSKVWSGTITVSSGTTFFRLATSNQLGTVYSTTCQYATYSSPTSVITANPTSVDLGSTTTLTSTEENVVSREWQQSTNSGVSWQSVGATNPISVTLSTAGTHLFRCKVTGNGGLTAYSNTVSVFAGDVPSSTITSPTMSQSFAAGQTVSFVGEVSADTESFVWDFGGTYTVISGSGTLTPTIRYSDGGSKTITLKAINRYGSDTATVNISVGTSVRKAAELGTVKTVEEPMGSSMLGFINAVVTPNEETQQPDIMAIFNGVLNPYTSVVASWLFLFLFAVPFVILWIRQKSTIIPSIIGIIFAVFMFVKFPSSAIMPACVILALSIAGGLYGLYVKMSNR